MYEKNHKIKRPRIDMFQTQNTDTTISNGGNENAKSNAPAQQDQIWLPIPLNVQQKLGYFLKQNKIPHLLFHGNLGTGKKTIVQQFIREIFHNDQARISSNVMWVNCAHEKGIQFIRGEIKTFARINVNCIGSNSNRGNEVFKVVVLHNADKLTTDAQSALRRSIEIYSHNTRFFIIVENVQKIMNPILSRFCEIYVPDRMDRECNIVPLHRLTCGIPFTHHTTPHPLLTDVLLTMLGNPSTTNLQWIEYCNKCYESGLSSYDLIHFIRWFTHHNSTSYDTGSTINSTTASHITTTTTPTTTKLPPHLLELCEMEFQKVKSEFRCEKLLLLYLIHFILGEFRNDSNKI
jgi:hypothetical protein